MDGRWVLAATPGRTRTTDTVVVLAPQPPVAVAFCQHPAPRGLVADRSQATQTPHRLVQFEMDKATKLVLGVVGRAGGGNRPWSSAGSVLGQERLCPLGQTNQFRYGRELELPHQPAPVKLHGL